MNAGNFADIKSILFENKTIKQTIFKNTFWLGVSTVFNKLLALVLLIYAARILGAEEYGKFAFALALVSLLMIFSDMGLSAIITREFAREKGKEKEFYSIFSLKILLILGTFILILLSSFTLPQKDIQRIVLIMALFLLINGFMDIFYSFFHARQKMEYEAWPEIFQVALIFAFGIFILLKFPSAENLSYAYLFASLVALILVLVFFHFRFFPLKIDYNFLIWKKFLIMSWPLALMGLFGLIYGYTDSVMLGYWGMMKETGWYNAAQKIVTAALVPMGLISASFYPALSKFSKESKEKFQKAWNSELEIMIILALPLVVGGIALSQRIIYSFYSLEFVPSVLAFQLLILTAGIIFLYRPFYDAMIVLNQQTKMFLITLSGAIVNVVLNFFLIPKYTLYGAAFTTIITNVLIFLIIVFFAKKYTYIQLHNLKIFCTFLVATIASALMYLVIKQPLIYNINIFLLIITGAVIYLIAFLTIRKYIFRYFEHAYI